MLGRLFGEICALPVRVLNVPVKALGVATGSDTVDDVEETLTETGDTIEDFLADLLDDED